MSDSIYGSFIAKQHRESKRFMTANPGFCQIQAMPEDSFLVHLNCPVMRKPPGSLPMVSKGCHLGITLGPDYCRSLNPGTVTILTPFIFHPNIAGGVVCLGRMAPATPLVDLLMQVYSVLIWQTHSPGDPLNPEAAQWARNNTGEIPLEGDRVVRIPKPETATAS